MMKKTSKRPSDSRHATGNPLSKSKAFVSLRPQRTMTTPSESLNSHSNNILIDSKSNKTQADESFPTTNIEEPGFSNEDRTYIWAKALTQERMVSKLEFSDEEIEQVSLDLPNQRVVNGDCMRTRVTCFSNDLKLELEKVLTFYCKKENITYKQGLNEVAAPFINFRKGDVSISNIYNYLVLFIDRFLPTAFIDKDFLSLQCYFRILNILLRYHDPAFHTFLDRNDYPPEIYATPWFLTLFANKLTLEMVYLLWDIYILENDPYLIFFFAVALLIENKNRIMSGETYMIPQNLANLNIENATQMIEIYKKAIDLRLTTPPSFLGILQELDVFKKGYLNQNELKETMQRNMELLEQVQCVLMSPYEIVNTLYSTELHCSNPKCCNYRQQHSLVTREPTREFTLHESFLSEEEGEKPRTITPGKRELKTRESMYLKSNVPSDASKVRRKKNKIGPCVFCKSEDRGYEFQVFVERAPHIHEVLSYKRGQRPWLEILILDLRINKDEGLLPKSHTIDISKLNNDTINVLINDLIELRGDVHFVFMTTDFNSSSFRNYMKETYKKERLESPPPLNKKQLQNNGLDEDNLLFKFLEEFLQNGFPYLSVLEGGFNGVNRVLHEVSIEVLNHNIEKCAICNGSGEKKKSLFNFFNKVFDKTGKRLNLLVEGINSKTPGRPLQGPELKSANAKANALANAKKEKSGRSSSDLKEKPRSITSIPTPPHTLTYLNSQDLQDTTLQTSTYLSSHSSLKTRTIGGSSGKPSEIASSRRALDSEYSSIAFKEGDDNSIVSKNLKQPFFEEIEHSFQSQLNSRARIVSHRIQPPLVNKNTVSNQEGEGDKQWELPFKSYFDLQVSPRSNNHFKASLQKKQNSQEFAANNSQDAYQTKKGGNLENSSNLGLPYSPGNTLHASRYVFEQKKRLDSKENEKRFESSEIKKRKFVSPQDDRYNGSIDIIKTKSNSKNPNVTQSTVLTKGTMGRKNVIYEDFQAKKPIKAENMGMRNPGTPISQLLDNEQDVIGNRQKSRDEYKGFRQNETEVIPSNENVYTSIKESLVSPKSMMVVKKTSNGNNGKALNQSGREVEKGGKTNSNNNSRNVMTLSLNMTDNTFNSLAATLVEFPGTETSSRKQVESCRKEVKKERKESLENAYDILTVRSPLKITQSPSPIKGSGSTNRDKVQKDNFEERFGWREMGKNFLDDEKSTKESGMSKLFDSQINDFYYRSGMLERVHIAAKDQIYFYKMFENVRFYYFVCDHVLEVLKEDVSINGTMSVKEYLSKRILIISKDFLMSVQYENEVLDNLRLLQKGFSLEKMIQYSEERRNLIGSLDIKSPLLRVSTNIAASPKGSGLSSKINPSFKDKLSSKREIVVEAMYPTKLLLRITSKKFNGKYLSFYFKLPTLEKLRELNNNQSLTFTENNISELYSQTKKDDYIVALKDISDNKDPLNCLQSKSVYYFENESTAQECIHITKDAYNQASSYINEKLGIKP